MNQPTIRYSFEGPPTSGVVVRGAENCGRTICFLAIDRSAWFEVTPLPNDEYKITYKDEHHKAVLAECDREPSAEEILAEFMGDVEAAEIEEVAYDWPDLMVTYCKAQAYFENLNH